MPKEGTGSVLSRTYSLKKEGDFKAIWRRGRLLKTSFFKIKYLINNFSYCRFAVIVSKKLSNKATKRNRLRRQILHILREAMSNFKNHLDVVILTMNPAAASSFSEIKEELTKSLKKINL